MKVFTPEQMRALDRRAIDEWGLSGAVLMENAALRCVEWIESRLGPGRERPRLAIFCGPGNNGGDGLAIARHLAGSWPLVVIAASSQWQGEADANARALRQLGELSSPAVRWVDLNQEADGETLAAIEPFDWAIDALLGTGFRGRLKADGVLERAVRALGAARRGIVAVDCPSGLDCASGEADPLAPRCHATIALAAPKRGHFLGAGLELCGELWVGDIGTGAAAIESTPTGAHLIDRRRAIELLPPPRPRGAHKGLAGRVLVIGGSTGMSGAAVLTARAALRAGAGLVTLAVPEPIATLAAAGVVEAMSHALPASAQGSLTPRALDAALEWGCRADAIALGPGLGRDEAALDFAREFVAACPAALVIDADALHALPAVSEAVARRSGPTLLTPHPGEMAALLARSTAEVEADRFAVLAEAAGHYGATIVLKGAASLVHPGPMTGADASIGINTSGNPGMATGGSGDVLTGTLAALLASGLEPAAAAELGVWWHGAAGDLAASRCGNGLIAGDIASALAQTRRDLEAPDAFAHDSFAPDSFAPDAVAPDAVAPDAVDAPINPRLRRLR